MLYITSLWLIYFITDSLYLLIPFTYFALSPLGIMLSEWNKSDRRRQILFVFMCMWNIKSKTKEQYNKTETDSQIQITNLAFILHKCPTCLISSTTLQDSNWACGEAESKGPCRGGRKGNHRQVFPLSSGCQSQPRPALWLVSAVVLTSFGRGLQSSLLVRPHWAPVSAEEPWDGAVTPPWSCPSYLC